MHRGEIERLRRRFGGERLEAGLAQHHFQRAHDLRLVVDHEDSLPLLGSLSRHRARSPPACPAAIAPLACPLERLRSRASRAGLQRQLEHERRPLPGQRLDMQLAAVGLGEPAGDRQAEPRAAMPVWAVPAR